MSDEDSQLQPCIAELLRTCVQPRPMVLEVRRIVTQEMAVSASLPSGPSTNVQRFYLTDGELCIQALLNPTILSDYDLKAGDRIQVRDLVVKRAKRLNGPGKVVYVNVREFRPLQNYRQGDVSEEGGFIKDHEEVLHRPAKRRRVENDSIEDKSSRMKPTVADTSQRGHIRNESTGSANDDFESFDIDLTSAHQRRQILRSLQRPNISTEQSNKNGEDKHQTPQTARDSCRPADPAQSISITGNTATTILPDLTLVDTPNGSPRTLAQSKSPVTQFAQHSAPIPSSTASDHTSKSMPGLSSIPSSIDTPIEGGPASATRPHSPNFTPPFHTLHSLLDPSLATRSQPISVVAIIEYVSPSVVIPKPNSPFPPKRNIKIIDHTLKPDEHAQGIILAVHIDAAKFTPKPGTLAMFRGVVAHQARNTVILNAYTSLRNRPAEEPWYIDEEGELKRRGVDVDFFKIWWNANKLTTTAATTTSQGVRE